MKNISFLFLSFIALLFTTVSSKAQQNRHTQTASVEVIQFHSEHRCKTCLKIEQQTKSTLAKYFPDIPFSLVNVDDKKNAKKAEQFEASGTALFLYNTKTGRKKDPTDFAFLQAGADKKFEAALKKHIEDFIKG